MDQKADTNPRLSRHNGADHDAHTHTAGLSSNHHMLDSQEVLKEDFHEYEQRKSQSEYGEHWARQAPRDAMEHAETNGRDEV